MNTKSSTIAGWIAYTVAFGVGAYYGINRYWNKPGGRKDREAEADRKRAEEEVQERLYEERVRKERAMSKLQREQNNIATPSLPSDPTSVPDGSST